MELDRMELKMELQIELEMELQIELEMELPLNENGNIEFTESDYLKEDYEMDLSSFSDD